VSADEALDSLACRLTAVIDESGPDAVGAFIGNGVGTDAASWSTVGRFLRAIGSRSRYTALTIDAPSKPLIAELVGGHAALTPHVDLERTTPKDVVP
jgi:hypothetical protein